MAGAVRQPIDQASLERYLQAEVPRIVTPVEIKQFGFGQSNPTYLLTASDGPRSRFVLRKKPPGQLLSQTAHRVDREFRILRALATTDVPVPETIVLCQDASVIGTAFYIMGFVEGRHFDDPTLPGVSPAERTALWTAAVETLAKLHRVDYHALGLGSFGKPSGFYPRQLATFSALERAQAAVTDAVTGRPVGPIPHFDAVAAFFADAARQPRDRAVPVHGDFKIDNLLFHPTQPVVVGVLDWEMATIGHPLSDLANLTSSFIGGARPEDFDDSDNPSSSSSSSSFSSSSPPPGLPAAKPLDSASIPGLPSRPQLLATYARSTDWDPADELPWADAFHALKYAIIMQGIAARVAGRQASSAQATAYARMTGPLGRVAWRRIRALLDQKDSKVKL